MSRIPYTNKVGETLGSIADSAAAYSLRALNGGDPMVARVRRSSDDAEKDFTASDMDSGSVADWVNGKQDTTLPCDVASAAAAYSLRSVNSNYTGSVVRVRRSSDDAEKDFAASDVSGGALVDWVNEDVVHTMDNGTYAKHSGIGTISSATNTGFIIDSGASGLAVWSSELSPNFILNTSLGNTYRIECTVSGLDSNASVRIVNRADGSGLSTSYTISNGTNTILISTDLSTTSIYATLQFNGLNSTNGGSIQNITVTQTKANGHVTTWYDQSGNGNNATQSTASSQPKIVDAGVYLGELNFLSSTTTLSFSDIACGTTYSFFCALPRLDVSNFKIISDGGAAPRIDFERGTPDLIEVVDNNFGNKKFQTTNLFLDSNSLTSIINASTTFNVFHNGNASVTNPFTIPNHSTFNTLGGQAAGGVYEVILYNTDQSSNRFKIESNINNHYGLYTNANDGFVTSWYDQSGNDNHATQSTAGSQPKIVDAGVLVSDGIKFDGVDDKLYVDGNPVITASNSDSFSSFSVQSVAINEEGFLYGCNNIGSFAKGTSLYANTNNYTMTDKADKDHDYINRLGGRDLLSLVYIGNQNPSLLVNASGTTIDSFQSYSFNSGTFNFTIGARAYSSQTTTTALEGSISEIIIYNSDQSANRVAIETNINNHYDIY